MYISDPDKIPLKGKGSKLSDRMRRFIDEYFVDFDKTKAILRAGYNTQNPNKMGTQVYNHPLVLKEINRRMRYLSEKTEVDRDYVIKKIKKIVEDAEDDNAMAALRGLEMLAKSLGMFIDKQEISGPDGKAIEMEQRVKEDVTDFKGKLARIAESTGTATVLEFPKSRSTGSS